jgi:hypothetical protein
VEGAMESIKASSTYFQIISRDYKVRPPSKQNEKKISRRCGFCARIPYKKIK